MARGVGASAADGAREAVPAVNEVHLVGRVAAAAQSRALPSGDTVTLLRVVVRRSAAGIRSGGPTVDTVDCAIWAARLRQRAERLTPGSLVEIDGALRRRFWRTPAGPVSRYEVEVRALKRLVPVRGVDVSPPARARARPT